MFDPTISIRFPRLEMVDWFEWDKYETEVKAEVDWAATRTAVLARAFAADLPSRLRWAGSVPDCAAS